MANIALYPGGYKPPHIGHYKAAKIATEQTDKVIVFVGPKERDGITQDMSVKLWTLYTQKDPIEITVNLEGEVYIGESLVEVDNLIPRINAITEQNTEARIYIRGDRVVAYGRVMEIMSIINSAGYVKVALITQNLD